MGLWGEEREEKKGEEVEEGSEVRFKEEKKGEI